MTPCWVLHRRAYRETSSLVELLGPEGRIRGVARGKSTTAQLQPFVPLVIDLGPVRELYSLKSVEPLGPSASLSGNALVMGLYANELLVKLLPDGLEVLGIQSDYANLIKTLAVGINEGALRDFENALLNGLGFGLDLTDLDDDVLYWVHPESGPRPWQKGYLGRQLKQVASRQWDDPEILRIARSINRLRIDHWLAGRTLHSRSLFLRK